MKILIANPNTSTDMLALMLEEAHRGCRPGTEVAGIAADFGVPYIASHSEMAIAGHALLDSLARHHEGHDAVVVGAFCHAFVAAAKELMPVPVIGLAEAGVRAAQIHGRRICIIGLGASGPGADEERIDQLGGGDVVSRRGLPMSGTELVANQRSADAAVVELGRAAVSEDHADVIVLGGAAFAGMAGRISAELPVPVISPVHYAVGLAELSVASAWRKPSAGAYAPPGDKRTDGLTPELSRFFESSDSGR